MRDECETDVSGEVEEARREDYKLECWAKDVEQGIEPAGLYE